MNRINTIICETENHGDLIKKSIDMLLLSVYEAAEYLAKKRIEISEEFSEFLAEEIGAIKGKESWKIYTVCHKIDELFPGLPNKFGLIMEMYRQRYPDIKVNVVNELKAIVGLGFVEYNQIVKYEKPYLVYDKNLDCKVKEVFGVLPVSEEQNNIRKILQAVLQNKNVTLIEELPFHKLFLDFFIPEWFIAIEYDGPQHFSFMPEFHNSQEDFEKQVARDKHKEELCKKHGIKLIRIPYNEPMNVHKMKSILGGVLSAK